MRFILYRDTMRNAWLLTSGNTHAFLLTLGEVDLVAIKSGFSSGYGGEGPRGLSYVLQLLDAHGVEIEEYDVADDVMERLDLSALLMSDVEALREQRPKRPARWYDYIDERHARWHEEGTLWREFHAVIPLSVIDSRIVDLARSFWNDPDDKLLKGYRRLEDEVRRRTGLKEHGSRLFAQAFAGPKPRLLWDVEDQAEQGGRSNLFTAAFLAYRNRRAHRELEEPDPDDQLSEFLMLNQLYRLEREATLRPNNAEEPGR